MAPEIEVKTVARNGRTDAAFLAEVRALEAQGWRVEAEPPYREAVALTRPKQRLLTEGGR